MALVSEHSGQDLRAPPKEGKILVRALSAASGCPLASPVQTTDKEFKAGNDCIRDTCILQHNYLVLYIVKPGRWMSPENDGGEAHQNTQQSKHAVLHFPYCIGKVEKILTNAAPKSHC